MGKDLNKKEVDAIREILSIGAGNASLVLSDMTKNNVKINFPSTLSLFKLKDITSLIGSPHDMIASVNIEIKGKIGRKIEPIGNFFLLFKLSEAINFANFLSKRNSKKLDEYGKDILKETANTISGISFEAISSYLDFKIIESLPEICVDMLNSTIDPILSSIAAEGDQTLVFMSNFYLAKKKIKSHFFIVFHPKLYLLLAKKIKKEYTK